MSIKQKLTAGMATAAMMAGVLAPMSHAANVTVKGNGAGSKNVVAAVKVHATKVKQSNATVANTVVKSSANTGGNKTNFNTGGTTTTTTGKATSTVAVSVTGGTNTATVPSCGCPDDGNHEVTIQGNGAGSHNVVLGGSFNLMKVSQSNATVANTVVVSSANTGHNSSSFNTGEGTSSDTGNAESTVAVIVTGGDNDLN